MPENKQQEELRRQLYAQQQKARMAQRMPALSEGKSDRGMRLGPKLQAMKDLSEGKSASEQQMASQLAGAKVRAGLAAAQKAMAGEGVGAGEAVAEMGGGMATGQLLKQCWLNLIPSYGLTLIYINIHFFLRYLVGIKLFCAFGQEWGGGKAKIVGQEIGGKAEMIEIIIMFLLDFLVFFVILIILVVIYIFVHPTTLLNFGWEWVKSKF